jgi:hypothetical protein
MDDICELRLQHERDANTDRAASAKPVAIATDVSSRERPPRKFALSSVGQVFFALSVICSVAVGGCLILWWEENLKSSDNDRMILMDDPLEQIKLWGLASIMIASHVLCWSDRWWRRFMWLASCAIATVFAVNEFPEMPLLVGSAIGVAEKTSSAESVRSGGNMFLLLIPATALGGILFATEAFEALWREYRKIVVVSCVLLAIVGLSLFFGTRDNPSNIVSEFWLLSITFGLWMLGVVFARMSHAFFSFIGGRLHLDVLSRLWAVKPTYVQFRDALKYKGTDGSTEPSDGS